MEGMYLKFGKKYPIQTQGDHFDEYNHGLRYLNGKKTNHKKAIELLLSSAEKGFAPAQCLVGVYYYNNNGKFEGVNKEKGFYWVKKAAEQGYMEAQKLLGDMYFNGSGIKKNKNKAYEWYEKAAEHNKKDKIRLLMRACDDGFLPTLERLISQGVNINAKDEFGKTALHTACREGHLRIVKYLMGKGFKNVNAKDKLGLTPLHYASYHGHLNVVKYLVEDCKADVNANGTDGTPIDWARYGKQFEVEKYLQKKTE
jgi:TPR repeat protein